MYANRDTAFLKRLAAQMTTFLQTVGFSRGSGGEWTREWGWKLDTIEITGLPRGVLINFYVWLPCHTNDRGEREHETLAMSGLGHIIGQGHVELRPSWFQGEASFVARILESLCRGLTWYDQFQSPRDCLSYLQKNVRPKGSPNYTDCEQYLLSLSPDRGSIDEGRK